MSTIKQDTSANQDLDAYQTAKYDCAIDGSAVTTGGEDNFTRYDVGGVGPDTDSNITAGGLSIA